MKFSHFFVDRPIFAAVLSVVIFIAGLLALFRLPVSEYPEVVPPSVVVRAAFPGANPKVIAETVASPLEESINGVEDMLYMSSQSTADGALQITVTFKLGTDVDKAQVQIQNRVAQALPRLPEQVRLLGVTSQKSSSDLTMVVHLLSPDNRYDALYLRNYAVLNLRDEIARIPGVGQAFVFGAGDYAMRVWLDPQKVAARQMTATDVVRAIREQNVQVAAGVVGAPPVNKGVDIQLSINAAGRLSTEEEFREIIVKAAPDGTLTRLKDIARVELGAKEYGLRSLLNNKPAVAIAIFQAPGSNAIALSNNVRDKMAELKRMFPESMDFSIVYDPTVFVRDSIKEVIITLFEAILLVVIVVIVFLQTWRASIIPLVAVPVSIVGTFALMLAFGFSINALTLFGLVLAIGIVVDDAIVVVENVERNIELGYTPREAAYRAMDEVSGPIIAIALVLCAVFIPIAFVSGLTGQFYRQFALTIAISTVISAFNSLTLSPALAALLLRPHGAKPDWFARLLNVSFGWFFRPFNRFFKRSSDGYSNSVGRVLRVKSVAMVIYILLIGLTWFMFQKVPGGFVPGQDKQYLVGFAQLPDGASLDRTEVVIRKMSDIALSHPGVKDSVAFPGLSINGFTNSPNAGIVFFTLKDFSERKTPDLSGFAIAGALTGQLSQIQDAFIAVFPPPAVMGLGSIGGFKLMLEDRAGLGYEELYKVTGAIQGQAWQTPGLAQVFSGYQINVPQLNADVDRTKARRLGVAVTDVFETMQIYLGSLYANDFNLFGRTYQVIVQADADFRSQASDIAQLKTRNAAGEMVPLGSVLKVTNSYGPDRVTRYNAYPAADINGAPAPGVSSGQARALIEDIVKRTIPNGIAFEWTELTYQEILAGNTMIYVFPLCVLLVFLVLAALYESFTLPLAIVLIVPMCLLCAITGVWYSGLDGQGGDNNIFTQIGLFVLVGLACKNAILIVEFARELEHRGASVVEAAIAACKLRLRPILMTSFAFIMGVIPLVLSSGAGAEMREAMGVAVFSGMLGVTFFGLFLTPVFYVMLRKLAGERPLHHATDLNARPVAPVVAPRDKERGDA
ncbi:MAG: efflux RND transporter permease subunit [Burkholderiales bacterium]